LPRVRGVLRGLGATGGVLRVIRTRTGVADIAALVGLDFALTTVAAVSLAFFGDPNAWPAAIFFALGGGLLGWIALALGTRRRHAAITAAIVSSVIVVGIVVFFIGLVAGGGD